MKIRFYHIFVLLLLVFFASLESFGQGCVAVRNMSSCSLFDTVSEAGALQVSLNYRYFRSFRHFVGTDEQEHRLEENTEVINKDNSVVLGLNYSVSSRLSIGVAVPFIYIDRSSLYEHKGNTSGERYHTQSKGLGDVRVTGYYNAMPRGSATTLVAGLGIKLPTGNYNYKDYFHKPEGLTLLPVDQSIQPGDGGTGAITEVNFAQRLGTTVSVYATAYYLFNPRNTNGTLRGPNLVAEIPLSNEMSVADQYLFRAGGAIQVNRFQFGAGARWEGIPSEDLIGDSDGFRRPGYIVSAEGSILYSAGPHSIGLQLPVALERNRTRSVIDKTRGINPRTGTPFHGDAAFADWLVSVTYTYRGFRI